MKVLNIKKATPMFSGLIVTCDRYTEEDCLHGGILDTTKLNQIKDMQTVISPSEQCIARGIKVNDTVILSYERYKKSKNVKRDNSLINDIDETYAKQSYFEMPVILLDNRQCLLVDLNDITLKVDEFEYEDEGDGLLSGINSEIILN